MESPRPTKRRRTIDYVEDLKAQVEDVTDSSRADEDCEEDDDLLKRATHVLATEAAALHHITRLYQTDSRAKGGLRQAVQAILAAQAAGGKVIACGVGKSAYIAMKFVATCKSLGIGASFMHGCEAVHGDLGDIRPQDVLLFISFSGKTPELLNILPHVSTTTRVVAVTSHALAADCRLLDGRADGILMSAPIPEKEETSFGVAAPTTSTTVALAVADMLVLTVADQLHAGRTKDVFKANHPGGAIGMTHKQVKELSASGEDFTVLELPSPSISGSDTG